MQTRGENSVRQTGSVQSDSEKCSLPTFRAVAPFRTFVSPAATRYDAHHKYGTLSKPTNTSTRVQPRPTAYTALREGGGGDDVDDDNDDNDDDDDNDVSGLPACAMK